MTATENLLGPRKRRTSLLEEPPDGTAPSDEGEDLAEQTEEENYEMTQTEEQAKMNREGKGLAKEHEEARAKVEGKISAQNEAWLKAGKANDRVIGAGNDGTGTKGLNAAAHKLAQKLIGR
jgi:hypothetical protein